MSREARVEAAAPLCESSALGRPASCWSRTVTARLKAATRPRSPVAARWAITIEASIPPEQMPKSATCSCCEMSWAAVIASMIAWP